MGSNPIISTTRQCREPISREYRGESELQTLKGDAWTMFKQNRSADTQEKGSMMDEAEPVSETVCSSGG